MKRTLLWLAIVAVVTIGGVLYYWKQNADREATVQAVPPAANSATAEVVPKPVAEEEPVHTPPRGEPAAASAPLPPLDGSDEALRASLSQAGDPGLVQDIVITRDLARRVVATIDNLPRRKLADRLLPLKLPPGSFVARGQGDNITLSPENYPRYGRYVALGKGMDAKRLVSLYVHYYPLLQQAYRELGYPKKQFHDRVYEAIDDILSAPEAPQTIELVRPKVFYEFEDPDLEELSAGRKLMLRMGPDNAAMIKAKLKEIRDELETTGSHR
jgi:hypothetical protein